MSKRWSLPAGWQRHGHGSATVCGAGCNCAVPQFGTEVEAKGRLVGRNGSHWGCCFRVSTPLFIGRCHPVPRRGTRRGIPRQQGEARRLHADCGRRTRELPAKVPRQRCKLSCRIDRIGIYRIRFEVDRPDTISCTVAARERTSVTYRVALQGLPIWDSDEANGCNSQAVERDQSSVAL